VREGRGDVRELVTPTSHQFLGAWFLDERIIVEA
jgi:hypothetical protein